MSIFVDSSIRYTAADRGARHNHRAKQFLTTNKPLVTSDSEQNCSIVNCFIGICSVDVLVLKIK